MQIWRFRAIIIFQFAFKVSIARTELDSYSLSRRKVFIALLKDLGEGLSWIIKGISFHSFGPAYVICLADWWSLLYETDIWFLLLNRKLEDKLEGIRLFFNFHMKLACFSCKVSSKGRIDNFLKSGSTWSSWDLKLIIRIAFLVLLLIFSRLADGAVPQFNKL